MALIETLKAALMFLGIMALILFVVIAGEIAFMILVQIIDEFRDRRRRRRIWED